MSDSYGLPPSFLPSPGCPPIPWIQWKISFMAFQRKRGIHLTRLQNRHIADGEDAAQQPAAYSDAEKNLDLYLSLGPEGQRLFNGTPDAANFDRDPAIVLAACDLLFRSSVNRRLALLHFRFRNQLADETADEFVTELRLLAQDCHFVNPQTGLTDIDWENREIADTFVTNCYDKVLQQKFFTSHSDSTLEQLLTAMRADEAAKRDVFSLQSDGPVHARVATAFGYSFPQAAAQAPDLQHQALTTIGRPLLPSSTDIGTKIVCPLHLRSASPSTHPESLSSFIADSGSDVSTITRSAFSTLFPDSTLHPSPLMLLHRLCSGTGWIHPPQRSIPPQSSGRHHILRRP